MSDKLAWFRFYPQDFLGSRKVKAMKPEDVGYYIKLLCHEWEGGPLPLDMGELAILLGVSARTMTGVWQRVGKCFVETDVAYVNERLESIREEQLALLDKRRVAGSDGAKKRWGNRRDENSKANGIPNGIPNSKANAEPLARAGVKAGKERVNSQSVIESDYTAGANGRLPHVSLPSIPVKQTPEVASRVRLEKQKLARIAAATSPPDDTS